MYDIDELSILPGQPHPTLHTLARQQMFHLLSGLLSSPTAPPCSKYSSMNYITYVGNAWGKPSTDHTRVNVNTLLKLNGCFAALSFLLLLFNDELLDLIYWLHQRKNTTKC